MDSALLSRHAVHLLAVGIPAAMLAVGLSWDAVRQRRNRAPESRVPMALVVAAAATVVAAAVHVAVIPQHLREWIGYGLFFIAAAVVQLVTAGLLLRSRSRSLALLVGVGNAAVIVLWLATRLVAVPVGPDAGTAESFGALDLVASSAEAIVVIATLTFVGRSRTRTRTRIARPAELELVHG